MKDSGLNDDPMAAERAIYFAEREAGIDPLASPPPSVPPAPVSIAEMVEAANEDAERYRGYPADPRRVRVREAAAATLRDVEALLPHLDNIREYARVSIVEDVVAVDAFLSRLAERTDP